jgi:hypothetical protein
MLDRCQQQTEGAAILDSASILDLDLERIMKTKHLLTTILLACLSLIPYATAADAAVRGGGGQEDLFPFDQRQLQNNRPAIAARSCAANPSCTALGLTGECCPSLDGVFLDCCSSKCHENAACAAQGLQGECCPTMNGVFLDCCNPRECANVPACAAAGLEGACCPTVDNVNLQCCSENVPVQCELNPRCKSHGLTGSCCPVSIFLAMDNEH